MKHIGHRSEILEEAAAIAEEQGRHFDENFVCGEWAGAAEEIAQKIRATKSPDLRGDKTLWIVGQAKSDDGKRWEFQGVFDTEQLAVDACKGELYCVAPVQLNEELPHETLPMPGCYYPLFEPAPGSGGLGRTSKAA